ncbi:hypothetical protein OF001_U30277 [Pseudomonas sp. OF001]|nr:hypothetical protein OF001_U30277 [Pseudomonas sp. OF001]
MEVGIPQDPQPWLPQHIVSLACDPLRTLRQQRAILQLSRMDQIEGVQRLTALAAPLHDSYQKTFTDQFVTTITTSLYVTSRPTIVRGLFCPNFGASPLTLQLFAGAEIRPRHIARGPAYPPPRSRIASRRLPALKVDSSTILMLLGMVAVVPQPLAGARPGIPGVALRLPAREDRRVDHPVVDD